jgi:hypothetical protein
MKLRNNKNTILVQFDYKRTLEIAVLISIIALFISCNGGGGSESSSLNKYKGTYNLSDYSVQSYNQTFWASQTFESFAVDCIIHEDGFMEFSGCFKFPGEPELCGGDAGMIEGDILTISEPSCTYSGTVKLVDGNLSWEFPPSCGNNGNGSSVWHWTMVSDTTPKSLMSPDGESINMITESINMTH